MNKAGYLVSAAVAALMGGTAAYAQQAATAQTGSTDADNGALEEVVVTAEKRSEDVQKVPIVVETRSGDELVRSGALQLRDIERAIPDVVIAPQGSAVTMMIRGVFSTDTSPGSENADSINLDGAFLAKTQGIQGLLFDVDRFEVDFGPQGTLYGRNANGGAINIITKKAVIGEDSASGSLEVGSYQLIHGESAINMSVSDSLSLRAAVHYLSHEGYLTGGQDDADEKSGRAGFFFKPNENESLWGTFDVVNIGGNNAGTNVVFATPGSHVFVPTNPRDDSYFTQIIDPLTGAVQANRTNEVTYVNSHNNGMTLQNDYNFGPAVWTTQFNWRNFWSQSGDINNWADQYCPTAGAATCASPASASTGAYGTAGRNIVPQHFDSQSLETRLTSTATTPLKWVVGLYAFHDRDGGTMIGYANLTTQTPSIQIANGGPDIGEHAESYAGFGQLTWSVTDKLHLVGGLRYTEDLKNVQGIFTQFGPDVPPLYPNRAITPPKSNKWNKATWLAGVNYDLTDKNMVYAKVSTGYEAGGFSYGPGVNVADGPVYGPETITAYEVGSKNRFLDDRLQVNLAAWEYKYKDYQTNLALFRDGVAGPPVLTATSAGSATYKGASADVQYAITKADRLKLAVTLLQARYGQFVTPLPAGYSTVPGVNDVPQVLTGQKIFTVPAADGSLIYDHTFQLAKGSLDWQGSANFKGNTILAEVAENGFGLVKMYQKAFYLFNTSLRYDSENGKWSATIYDNNIANALKYRSGAIAAPSWTGGSGYYEDAQFYDPRIIGVIFQAKIM